MDNGRQVKTVAGLAMACVSAECAFQRILARDEDRLEVLSNQVGIPFGQDAVVQNKRFDFPPKRGRESST
jgi:hypothetical protein